MARRQSSLARGREPRDGQNTIMGFTGSTGARRSTIAGAGEDAVAHTAGSPRQHRSNNDSPVSASSGRSSSNSPSPERSTPVAKGGKENRQQEEEEHSQLPRQPQQRQKLHKKQPLVLQRAQWQHHQQQQRVVRPAPRGLAAAAATAAARTAGRHSLAALPSAAAAAGAAGDAISPVRTPEADDDAVAAAALGADRAAGARAMRGALEGLRTERDSLANMCGRLEADREAAMVQLREGADRVKELMSARETLEREKAVLEERCAGFEKEEEEAREKGKANALEVRVSVLEKERDETANLVRACEGCFVVCGVNGEGPYLQCEVMVLLYKRSVVRGVLVCVCVFSAVCGLE